MPVPACIKYIYAQQGEMSLAVQRQLPTPTGIMDPFAQYPHFPVKLYSAKLADMLEAVKADWIRCHFAHWQLSPELAVILTLSQVCTPILSTAFY